MGERQEPSIEDLEERCKILLAEMRAFSDHLRTLGRDSSVELRGPQGAVESELKSLKKLSFGEDDEETQARVQHVLRSSNVPYHEAVWSTAKRSSGVIAFSKRFFWEPTKRTKTREDIKTKYRHSALVDIVADNGAEWIKVSTTTQTRIVFELAKQGWEAADDSSEDQDERPSSRSKLSEDDEDGVSIVRMAEDLIKASKIVRVRYKHPRIRLVLPKISRGVLKEVDKILDGISSMGVTVQTAPDIIETPPDLSSSLSNLLVDEFANFSEVLNIDCTILLALVSDLSHAQIIEEPWFHTATRRQIEMEAKETLLPSSLYPAMGKRPLVCTKAAAQRMREIVDTIGTGTEKSRTKVMMGDDTSLSQYELVERFGEVSDYPVPREWKLPIQVVDEDEVADEAASLPSISEKVSCVLTNINKSVFLYGWRTGRTTITSNKTVARLIEDTIENNRGEGDENVEGPPVWLCPMARSLVGKEKTRKPDRRKR